MHGLELVPGDTPQVRLAPPEGTVKYAGIPRDLSKTNIGGRINTSVSVIDATDRLSLAFDNQARINLDATMERYAVLGIEGIVTSSYRSASSDYAAGGSGEGDHTRGLALDVAYGDYAQTLKAFNDILSKAKLGEFNFIRQIIFENVRATPRGYHVHIGFYPAGERGPVNSKLWFSAKDIRARGMSEGGSRYHVLKEGENPPKKEVFEDV
jgi:hypothetical protein